MKIKNVSPQSLSPAQIERMAKIMNDYYDNFRYESFHKDLLEKTEVILLMDGAQEIQGFSTLMVQSHQKNNQEFISVFSGDTVVTKEYWGNGALTAAFGQSVFRVKWRHFTKPVYWFLISKGYKTYLMMTNNFDVYYPRFENQTPAHFQDAMNDFYGERYPDDYSAKDGIIRFSPEKNYFLKGKTVDLQKSGTNDPKIKFFGEKNPNWTVGEELACVAEVTLLVALRCGLKRIPKMLFRRRKKSPQKALQKINIS